jgi:hypothetical protein
MDKASIPSTSSSLWHNVLESIVNQTLDHFESNPNLYSITDLNTLHALSNQINVRVQAIQRNVSHLASEISQSNESPSPSCKTTSEDKSNRELTSSDESQIGDAMYEDEKHNYKKKAQHEPDFPKEVSAVFF